MPNHERWLVIFLLLYFQVRYCPPPLALFHAQLLQCELDDWILTLTCERRCSKWGRNVQGQNSCKIIKYLSLSTWVPPPALSLCPKGFRQDLGPVQVLWYQARIPKENGERILLDNFSLIAGFNAIIRLSIAFLPKHVQSVSRWLPPSGGPLWSVLMGRFSVSSPLCLPLGAIEGAKEGGSVSPPAEHSVPQRTQSACSWCHGYVLLGTAEMSIEERTVSTNTSLLQEK